MASIFSFDMDKAPRDGTVLLLKVPANPEENSLNDGGPGELTTTIGFNNFDNDEIDEWKVAGWDWDQDEFARGCGRPVEWAYIPE